MSSGKVRTVQDILNDINNIDGISERERVDLKMSTLSKYVAWTDDDFEEYEKLLNKLKSIKRKRKSSTSEIGKALENIVTFIFEKSFFYKVYSNKHTATNEIDEFIVLSNRGKQALHDTGLTRELLISEQDYFLCECKNYKETVAATWVGKFNTLLDVCGDCEVGLIFSCNGLTGSENSWNDAHGLTKIIYRIHEDKGKNKKRFILDINLKDLEKIKDMRCSIFDIVQKKKEALIANVKSEKLYDDLHDGYVEIKKIFEEIQEKTRT